jgi:hypothetical protein
VLLQNRFYEYAALGQGKIFLQLKCRSVTPHRSLGDGTIRAERGEWHREAALKRLRKSQQGAVAKPRDQGQSSASQDQRNAQACISEGAVGRLSPAARR